MPTSLNLPCTGVETHAHLDLKPLVQEVGEVIQRARQAGVAQIGQVFLGPDSYEQSASLFADHDQVFFLLGVHPHEGSSVDQDVLERMHNAFLRDSRLKGLGEIGLDFYWDHSPHNDQKQAFREQLALAKEIDLPVIIHSRDATQETLDILDEMEFKDRPLLWHCFGGDRALTEIVLAKGWHISIPGTVTYPKNTALREAIPMIPLERMVLETDCPYLAPEPYRGKTNEPALMAFTAAETAKLIGVEPEELWTQCGKSAREFFGLEDLSG